MSVCSENLLWVFICAVTVSGQPLSAQAKPTTTPHLTVRPQEMATGARTDRAGEIPLDSAPIQWTSQEAAPDQPASIYVPKQCVGTRRCPLVLFVWTSDGEDFMSYVRPMADKYGMLLLSPGTRYNQLVRWLYKQEGVDSAAIQQLQHLDALLKQVLQKFAVDPDKIAIMGTCATGWAPLIIGGDNMNVFSRIISLSPGETDVSQIGPPTSKTEFLFDAGIDESQGNFRSVQQLRQKGYQVTHAFGFRVHGHQLESYDFAGRWLQATWTTPEPAARPAPTIVANSLPVLTPDVLTKMTAFWTRFMDEPDSVRFVGRQAHLRDVVVPVGTERPVVVMVNMAALAAAYPSIAADLKAAGLTAQEHDAYRVALASARAIKNSGDEAVIGRLDPNSAMAKNVAFMDAHPSEFEALENASRGNSREDTMVVPANMWSMP